VEIDWASEDAICAEFDLCCTLEHPCIVPMIGYRLPGKTEGPMIVSKWIPEATTLKDIFNAEEVPEWFNPTAKAIIVIGIVLAMRYAHAHGCLHRDLKPHNILIDKNHNPLLTDFGTAKIQDLELTDSRDVLASLYLAPEISEAGTITDRVDVWPFGIMLYEIVMAGTCSSSDLRRKAMCRVENGERPQIPNSVPEFVRKLIDDCWASQAEHRPAFADIYEALKKHNFLILEGVNAARVKSFAAELEGVV
jgi:serine/threonine-protein kinase